MKRGLRTSIYRSAVGAILGCGMATAFVVLVAGELLFRGSYRAAREASMADARRHFAIYDHIVSAYEGRARDATESALVELGRLYPDSSAIPGATAAGLRAQASRLGLTDLFLIGPEGHIRASSLEAEFGVDVMAAGRKSAEALRALYGSGRVAHQRLSQSARTGRAASYHYYSPPGSDILIEASMGLRDAMDATGPGRYDEFLSLVPAGAATGGGARPLARVVDLVGLSGGVVWSFAREGQSRPDLLPLVAEAREKGTATRTRGLVETLVLRSTPTSSTGLVAGERRFSAIEVDLAPLARFRLVAVLAGLVACGLSAAAAFLSAKRSLDRDVASRVERLEASVSRIALGDFDSAVDEGKDEIGAIARGIADMVRTITERSDALAASLAEKEELLREVHHRVKNNLQVIASLIDLQAGDCGDASVAAALSETRTRVHGMAMVHDELYRGGSLAGVDLRACLEGIAADIGRRRRRPGLDVELRVEAEGVFLHADKALPACLAASELIANRYEHAFPGRVAGRILVRATGGEGGFELSVEDDGEGAGGTCECLGLDIARALAAQLRGELRREAAGPGGERFVLAARA